MRWGHCVPSGKEGGSLCSTSENTEQSTATSPPTGAHEDHAGPVQDTRPSVWAPGGDISVPAEQGRGAETPTAHDSWSPALDLELGAPPKCTHDVQTP